MYFNSHFAVGGFKVGLDLLVEFEFRTTRTTGVLLGVSSQKMDGMGIEMIDEKVSISHLNISDLFMVLLFMCRNSILKLCCILFGRKLDCIFSSFWIIPIYVCFQHTYSVDQYKVPIS